LKNAKKKILSGVKDQANKFLIKMKEEEAEKQKTKENLANKHKHSYVTCDGCSVSPIIGNRYKCAVCEDFDYCENCEELYKDVHIHPFIKIRTWERAPVKIMCAVREEQNPINIENSKFVEKIVDLDEELKIKDKALKEKSNSDLLKFKRKLKKEKEIKEKEAKVEEAKKIFESATFLENVESLSFTVDENTEIRKQIKLVNNGTTTWSKYCTFVCLNNVDKNFYLRGNDVKLNMALKPADTINVEIFIPSTRVQKGKYTSVWQLRNEYNEYVGEQVTLNITAVAKEDKKKTENKIKILDPIIAIENKIEEPIKETDTILINKKSEERVSLAKLQKWRPRMELMKTVYSLDGMAEVRILSAIDKANGDLDIAISFLFV